MSPASRQEGRADEVFRVVVVSLMTHNLVVFYNTTGQVRAGQPLWPSSTKTWPTYVMLGVASLSTILATIVLLAYAWGTRAANRWNTARLGLTIATVLFMIIMWGIGTAGLQGTSDGGDGTGSISLWAATCDASDEKKGLFSSIINMNQFCLEQVILILCFC